MKIVGSVLVISAVLALNGCGTSKSIMSARYEKMETWQLCKKLLENDVPSFRISWVNEVIQKRGENCEPYIGKFSPPARIYSGSSSASKSESRRLKKLERENRRRKNQLDEIERKQREDAMWKDFNCSNAAWRKGYC